MRHLVKIIKYQARRRKTKIDYKMECKVREGKSEKKKSDFKNSLIQFSAEKESVIGSL
jgi:hypothetical protein